MYTGARGVLAEATANKIGALTEVVSPAASKVVNFF
jgi:hypothetical protein